VLAFHATAHLHGYRTSIVASVTAKKLAHMDINLTLKSVNALAPENAHLDIRLMIKNANACVLGSVQLVTP